MSFAQSIAQTIIESLKSINEYTEGSDDQMVLALAATLKGDEVVSVTRQDGQVRIELSVASDVATGSMVDFFAQVNTFGYTYVVNQRLTAESNDFIVRFVKPTDAEDTFKAPIKAADEATQRIINAAKAANEATRQANEATGAASKATQDANAAASAANEATESSTAAREALMAALGAQGKRAAKEAAWYTGKPAKYGAGTVVVGTVIAAAYLGLKHFGISIPFLSSDAPAQ